MAAVMVCRQYSEVSLGACVCNRSKPGLSRQNRESAPGLLYVNQEIANEDQAPIASPTHSGSAADPDPQETGSPESGSQETSGQDVETASSAIGEGEIAALAYHYWQERGCPEGCPEEDWLRAERDLAVSTDRDR
jgi:hypothetical protein